MEMESRVRIESTQASTSPQDEKNNVTTSLQSATVTRAQHDVDIHAVEAQLTNGTVEGWRLAVLAFSISLGLFLSMLDTSIISTALYKIEIDFDSPHPVTWVALSYTLAYLGCAVHFARLADIIGRHNANVLALVIFIAFSVGCGFAPTLEALIALRTLQGIAGSGLYSLAMVILPEIFPVRLQAMIGGVIGLVVTVSGILGPILGGVITQQASWRWIFWMNGPIGALALALFFFAWPRNPNANLHPTSSIRNIDIVGGVLLIAASVLVVFSFQEAGLGTSGSVWTSPIFLAPLVVGCVCWFLLFTWEAIVDRIASVPPLLPKTLFKRRVYVSAVLSTITMGFVYFVVIYALPTHFQVVYRKSVISAGVGLVPMLVAGAVGTLIGGALYRKPWTMFPCLMLASALMAIGVGLLSTVSSLQLDKKVYGFQVLVGLGFGLTVSNVTMLAVFQSSPEERAVAQGIIAQARVLGGSLGIAGVTAILGTKLQRPADEFGASNHASLSNPTALSGSQQLDVIRQAYTDAFTLTMRVTAVVACVSFLFALGTWAGRNPPDGGFFDETNGTIAVTDVEVGDSK